MSRLLGRGNTTLLSCSETETWKGSLVMKSRAVRMDAAFRVLDNGVLHVFYQLADVSSRNGATQTLYPVSSGAARPHLRITLYTI